MKKQTVFQWVFLMSLVGLATVLSCTSEFLRQAGTERKARQAQEHGTDQVCGKTMV